MGWFLFKNRVTNIADAFKKTTIVNKLIIVNFINNALQKSAVLES